MPFGIAAGAAGLAAGIGSTVVGALGQQQQVDQANAQLQWQKDQYNQQVARAQPFVNLGKSSVNALSSFLSNPATASYIDPGYAFRQKQGTQSVINNATALGMGQSGDTLRQVSQYNQDMASQEYNNAFNRWLSTGQFYGNLAGLGSNAVAGLGSNMVGTGSNLGNVVTGTNFAGPMQTIASGIGGLGGYGMNAFSNYLRPSAPVSAPAGASNAAPGPWSSGYVSPDYTTVPMSF